MAFLDEAIRSLLVNNATVAAAVSTRIYPVRAPDNPTLPMITYQRISNIRTHVFTGEQAKFTMTLLQVDIWAKESTTMVNLRSVAAAVRSVLDDYRGTTSGVDIQGILSENEFDSWDEESETFRISQSYRIMHRE